MAAIPTLSELVESIKENMKAQLNVGDISDTSVLHQLAVQFGAEVTKNYQALADLMYNAFISTASGPYLEAITSIFGIEREGSKPITRVGGIEFYTIDGAPLYSKGFTKDYLENNTVTVSDGQGLVIEIEVTPQLTNQLYLSDGINVLYLQTPSIIQSGKVVSFTADVVERGAIIQYSPLLDGVLVRNLTRIELIDPPETDESLRYKLTLLQKNKNFLTIDYIRTMLEADENVQMFDIKVGERGFGTLDIIIVPSDVTQTESVVQQIYDKLYESLPLSVDFMVRQPVYDAVVLNIEGSNIDRDQILQTQKDYILNIPFEGTLTQSDLANALGVSNLTFDIYVKNPNSATYWYVFSGNNYTSPIGHKLILHPDEDKHHIGGAT